MQNGHSDIEISGCHFILLFTKLALTMHNIHIGTFDIVAKKCGAACLNTLITVELLIKEHYIIFCSK